jgi:hypothetical protein
MKLAKYITKSIDWLKGSLDNLPGGASSKKLTAWGSFLIGAIITIIWAISAFKTGEWSLLVAILPMWLGLVYAALNLNSKEKEKGLLNQDNQ